MLDALEIGFAIKERRAQLGLTQAQVAQAAGVSKRCLWSLELGMNTGVQFDKLTAVLGALGLELSIGAIDGWTTPSTEDSLASSAPKDSSMVENMASSPIDAFAILTGAQR